MSANHPINLLVEGKMDGNFFYQLLGRMQLKDIIWLEDREGEPNGEKGVGGKQEFGRAISVLTRRPAYTDGYVKVIAIVRDADDDPGQAFAEAQNALRGNGLIPPDYPGQLGDANAAGVRTAIYIFPDAESTGYIENLFIRALLEEPHFVMNCVNEVWGDFLACFERDGSALKAHTLGKIQFNMFLVTALNDLPTTTAPNYIYDTSWFPWDSGAFDDIKQFLTMLADTVS